MPAHDWLVPDWPAPAGVRAVCTTRTGGVSFAPYDSLNLGDHVGDDAVMVAANRARFIASLGGAEPVFLQQVHGTDVIALDAQTSDGTQADACIATQRGIACTIMVADCLPILLCNRSGTAVAAAHAGWRGLANGVLERVHERFRPPAPMGREDAAMETIAWLGPCIGPDAFEVGPEVKAAFEEQDAGAVAMFKPHTAGKWLANLPGLARRRLTALGVTQVYGNDGSPAWCTVSNPSRFFSHRRDRVSGRFAAAVWLA